ncbi:MAG: hypothetical protein Harvfovirus2_36 [Harvfovirus sp.]|uniref:Uncharacterized protein n=1 Tax=Harvfovirus sp. TaxID=2487768 RepID=A0A3G4ZZU7_9VIRU|nr:MAG: hypothetical protein Harvfovirus2_36 [Harvfovirus sp.]
MKHLKNNKGDLEIKTKTGSIMAISYVLENVSEPLDRLLTGKFAEAKDKIIDFSHYSREAVYCLLYYLYSTEMYYYENIMISFEIYQLAEQYELTDLLEKIQYYAFTVYKNFFAKGKCADMLDIWKNNRFMFDKLKIPIYNDLRKKFYVHSFWLMEEYFKLIDQDSQNKIELMKDFIDRFTTERIIVNIKKMDNGKYDIKSITVSENYGNTVSELIKFLAITEYHVFHGGFNQVEDNKKFFIMRRDATELIFFLCEHIEEEPVVTPTRSDSEEVEVDDDE